MSSEPLPIRMESGSTSEHAARGPAEVVAERLRVLAELVAGECGPDRLEDPRARRVRVLVRVELEMSGSLSCSPGT